MLITFLGSCLIVLSIKANMPLLLILRFYHCHLRQLNVTGIAAFVSCAMSRRPDRKKHGKDSLTIANSKEESDAATLRSSDIDMQLRSVQSGQTVVGDTRGSLLQSRENSTPFQLLSEMGNSEAKSPDSKSSIVESLNVLKTKIDALLQKSGISD